MAILTPMAILIPMATPMPILMPMARRGIQNWSTTTKSGRTMRRRQSMCTSILRIRRNNGQTLLFNPTSTREGIIITTRPMRRKNGGTSRTTTIKTKIHRWDWIQAAMTWRRKNWMATVKTALMVWCEQTFQTGHQANPSISRNSYSVAFTGKHTMMTRRGVKIGHNQQTRETENSRLNKKIYVDNVFVFGSYKREITQSHNQSIINQSCRRRSSMDDQ
mmetsp:Transcript_1054/g.2452  ORF Transcript_1054/g.2452 Transcript_1054/m.2452 type:complete len:219 (-) Transcript_1054:69-725(-)